MKKSLLVILALLCIVIDMYAGGSRIKDLQRTTSQNVISSTEKNSQTKIQRSSSFTGKLGKMWNKLTKTGSKEEEQSESSISKKEAESFLATVEAEKRAWQEEKMKQEEMIEEKKYEHILEKIEKLTDQECNTFFSFLLAASFYSTEITTWYRSIFKEKKSIDLVEEIVFENRREHWIYYKHNEKDFLNWKDFLQAMQELDNCSNNFLHQVVQEYYQEYYNDYLFFNGELFLQALQELSFSDAYQRVQDQLISIGPELLKNAQFKQIAFEDGQLIIRANAYPSKASGMKNHNKPSM